jgi:hypothetical protein
MHHAYYQDFQELRPGRLEYLDKWIQKEVENEIFKRITVKALYDGRPLFEGCYGDD